MIKKSANVFLGFVLLLAAAGCDNPLKAAPGRASAGPARNSRALSASPAAAKMTRIAFVGKEQACECTRKRIDETWAALQKALDTPASLPVEMLQIDTDRSKIEPYMKQRPILAIPAIYFLDAKDTVLELLQGEVTEAQITAVLKR